VSRQLRAVRASKCNIKMYPRGMGCEVVGWMLSIEIRAIVGTVIDILIL
jgi:hypothetical protein